MTVIEVIVDIAVEQIVEVPLRHFPEQVVDKGMVEIELDAMLPAGEMLQCVVLDRRSETCSY